DKHPVTFFDHFTLVDLRSDKPMAMSYAFADGRMSKSYRFWVSHRYPPIELVRRAYIPGLCDALQAGAPIATDEALPPMPSAPDLHLLACWHNVLTARGDAVGAAKLAVQLTKDLPRLDATLAKARVGAAGVGGGKLRLVLFAGGPETGDLR